MKITIDQKALICALERGAMSALSDEAQRDTSSFHRLIQSVKITATKDELLFESGASQLATKWAIDLAEESGIEVKEEGIVLVPAKELFGWASKQFKSKIALTLVKLKVPEIIKTGDADTDYGSGQSISVKKIGTLKIVSRDESKTGNKWNLDCYDPEQMNSVDFEDAPKIEQLKESEIKLIYESKSDFDDLILYHHNHKT